MEKKGKKEINIEKKEKGAKKEKETKSEGDTCKEIEIKRET